MPNRYPAKRPWISHSRIASGCASAKRICKVSCTTRITSCSPRSDASRICASSIGEARVRYHAPLRFDDEYDIKVRVGEIRHSSWGFDYAIDRADGTHCADASTIQVMLDRSTGRATRIPPELRETLVTARGRAGQPR